MHYSSAKGLIAVLAIMLAAFAGLCDVPARAMPSGATRTDRGKR